MPIKNNSKFPPLKGDYFFFSLRKLVFFDVNFLYNEPLNEVYLGEF